MNDEILDDTTLAKRWLIKGTPQAIARRFLRLRTLPKKSPRHLKSFRVGNQVRYRLIDILEYEAKAR